MLKAILKQKRHSLSLFTAALAVYLVLFAGFSLFHAYSEDELIDPHGCAIGLCVQNGHASLLLLTTLALVLIHITTSLLPILFFPVQQISLQRAIRGPPYHASLC